MSMLFRYARLDTVLTAYCLLLTHHMAPSAFHHNVCFFFSAGNILRPLWQFCHFYEKPESVCINVGDQFQKCVGVCVCVGILFSLRFIHFSIIFFILYTLLF